MDQPHLIFRNTVALAFAKLVDKGASICLSFFIARYLGAAALGVYSAAIVFLNLISLAAEMGASNFMVREIARDRTRAGTYVIHFGLLSLLASGGVTIVSLLVVPLAGYSADLTASIYVIIFATLPTVLRIIQEAVFVGCQRVKFVAWSTIPGAILSAGASLILLARGHGIVAIIAVLAVTQYAITLAQFVFLNLHICRLRWQFSVQFARELLRRVRAFTGSSILGGLLARPEIIILSLFKNDSQIGFYSAALRIIDLWSIIPETYMRNVFPALSHTYVTDRQRGQAILHRSIKYLLAISLPLMAGIFVAAQPLVRLLYGSDFEPSIQLVRVMACCIPLGFLFELLWRLLAAHDQQHLMLRSQIFMMLVRLAGGYLLVASFASLGAAINTCLFLAGSNLLLASYARRDGTRLDIARLTWRLSLAAIVAGIAAAMFINRSDLWVVALATATFYVALVILFKALSPEDWALFRRIWQPRTAA